MLKLREDQVARMCALEEKDFIRRVYDDLVAQNPELGGQAGLLERLEAAHGAAVSLSILQPGHRTQFMHQEAWAPSFYTIPDIQAWLKKPGMSGDQRWADFMAVMVNHLNESA